MKSRPFDFIHGEFPLRPSVNYPAPLFALAMTYLSWIVKHPHTTYLIGLASSVIGTVLFGKSAFYYYLPNGYSCIGGVPTTQGLCGIDNVIILSIQPVSFLLIAIGIILLQRAHTLCEVCRLVLDLTFTRSETV